MTKSLVFIFFVIVFSLTNGQAQPKKMKMRNNAKAMRQEVHKHIPLGSSVSDGQRILAANGFNCTLKQKGSFVEINEDKAVVEHKNLDFLSCDKTESVFVSTRLWQVAIVHKNGVVTEILDSVAKAPVLRRKDYIHMSDSDLTSILLKYAPLGSSEDEVKRVLRHVFHRGYKKDAYENARNYCSSCPREKGNFTLRSNMQNYDVLRNLFFAGNYVLSVWYFDKNGVLREVQVSHNWDGV